MSVAAIIPARGGSKGIPGKNIKPLLGRPLLVWTIEAAQEARTVDRVVVSTDDDAIAIVAGVAGAQVIERPPELSGDDASSESALLHALDHLREYEGYEPTAVAFLQCTSPLTTADDIDGTVARVIRDGYNCAVTMAPDHAFLWRFGPDGELTGVNHDPTRRLRRQERPLELREVGAVYALETGGFLRYGHRFFGRIGHYLVPATYVFEMDEPRDWAVVEMLLSQSARVRGRASTR